ncbi:MAG: serine/threonine-protein kinase [Acidobacteria bacterium]|nr:serine/threonine-protein kinase [Acidobacteriota bacterium]
MTPEQHQQVGELFLAVKDLPPAERAVLLDQRCNGDDALRREVESLLQFQTQAEDFIETRALDVVARQIAADHSVLQSGMQVAHYRIVSPLGSGGMGEVFLAEDTQLNRQVALKILPPGYTHDPERLKRFQTEARAAAALNHPNIATVHAVEEHNGQYFIAMEYVAGQSLSQVIPADGLELDRFFELAIPLADALAHAHEKGVIHRDIKPGNIVVTEAGQPKILDFGLARISYQGTTVPNEPSLTPEGFVMGTPGYMSPEQAKGERADHRSDIFSFGVVMYELLTGRHPFRGGSFATFVSELLKEDPPPVSNLKPHIPSLLSRVVSQCLNKDHRRRYQTMPEVQTLLEGIKAECNEKAVTKTWGSPSTQPATSSRLVLVGLGLALMVMTGVALWGLFRPVPERLNPVTRFALTPRAGQPGIYSEVQLSPDGSAIVFDDTRNGQSQVFVRYFNQFNAQPVTGTEGGKRPFFSPDGQWIAFLQGEEKLLKVPVAGGTPLTLCDTCPAAFEMNWPTESHIFVSDTLGLYRVSAQGGTPERLTTINQSKGEKNHRAPQLLPDQEHVLFTVDAKDGKQCAVLSLETRQWQLVADLPDAGFARYLPSGHLIFHRSHQLLAVPFDPVQLKITGTPVVVMDGVFPNSDFKIAANGTLAYLPDESGAMPSQIHVVLNWTTELNAQLNRKQ